ncbi:hypothetical protein [Xanthomonas campestris]|uniref:hypothetical protein n=1 Tax=Xanthomonas campestris TaxID=339 RepID=UPI001E4FAB89|nr:hypothetical protein [Xanthomonas campestris]MCC8685889.1 hypothetical protein [Xanthomonas campestris]MCW1997293.1 hypothetical protein [Xanthomonas campestris]MEA9678991.1 hypothetical protein [Xanthomonas campestris pv. raphani]MEA9698428.1 hypothetical protein [Xanthomonas campestris pv. raphani]MEA9777748.1 hypothetical protein [Xanthomonas campestris pv. raphani]
MTQERYGITLNDAAVPLWVLALPRTENRHPNDRDGRIWRWLRLDRITQVMTELAVGHPADESAQYMLTITADGQQYHPTKLLIAGDDIDPAELYVLEHVNQSLDVLAKGRRD